MKDKLAICDLDGTLFDTSSVNYLAYKKAMAPYGINLNKDYFVKKCNGRHYTEFVPKIMGTDKYLEQVHRDKKRYYEENLQEARANQHLFRILTSIKTEYFLAIVTTASKKNTQEILQYFKYEDLFDFIVSQEDIINAKPDPEGFLKVMDYFKIDAEHTIIFEDSDVGIEAAKKTGASVFIIGDF